MMNKKQQQGYLTIVMITLIATVGLWGLVTAFRSATISETNVGELSNNQAFGIAQGGIERGTFALLSPEVTSAVALERRYECASVNFSDTLGEGEYEVVSQGGGAIEADTQLSSSISSSATVIPVDSISGFSSKGRVRIDRESIDYFGLSNSGVVCGNPPCIINAVRGKDGSSAVAHANNTPVSQFQCNLTVEGAVPDLGNSRGLRELEASVQLQQAWFVGNNDGSDDLFGFWNGVEWTQEGPFSGVPNQDIDGISMLSYTDGWAVGQSAKFYHWDGTSWNEEFDLGGTQLRDIDCVDSQNCWAVGNSGKIFEYNGTAWTEFVDFGSRTIRDVHCANVSDCWAVGNNKRFYEYDGGGWSELTPISGNDRVNGVYCNSETDCWAVGNSAKIYQYDGSTWSQFVDLGSRRFEAVFCAETNDCWAVGQNSTFARYDGSAWNIVSVSLPNEVYTDVACFTKNDCWAVGTRSGSSEVIVHWNGSSWSQFDIPGFPRQNLNAIALVGAKNQPTTAWQEVFR